MTKNITEHFNGFIGKEVAMTETPQEHTRADVALGQDDKVIRQIQNVAKQQGLSLRFFFPTHMAAEDDSHKAKRVNVTIGKKHGKYQVASVDAG